VRTVAVLAAAAAVLVGCSSGSEAEPEPEPAPTSPTTTSEATTAEGEQSGPLRLARVVEGLESPVHLTWAPGERERLYVVEQVGRIRVVEEGRLLEQPFLDIVDLVVSGGEQGLLSVAFHPEYESNRRFYVNYTDVNGDTRVVEYEATGGNQIRRRQLLLVDQPYANHNGGQLVFGPDGLLYVGMGDGGSGGDPENRAQNLSSRLGKLLRIDVDAPGTQWETVAYGLRNPWRFSFDRATDDLWIGDVGQGDIEEIDFLPRGTEGLVNFGWDVFEGTERYEDKEPNPAGELVDPIVEYSHDEGCSVTGGFVYRGESVPSAEGRYFYGDYCSGLVWSFSREEDERPTREPFEVDSLSSFGEDLDGELYLVSHGGTVYRLAQG
jgi:glucose/arabinose dehydrogenase